MQCFFYYWLCKIFVSLYLLFALTVTDPISWWYNFGASIASLQCNLGQFRRSCLANTSQRLNIQHNLLLYSLINGHMVGTLHCCPIYLITAFNYIPFSISFPSLAFSPTLFYFYSSFYSSYFFSNPNFPLWNSSSFSLILFFLPFLSFISHFCQIIPLSMLAFCFLYIFFIHHHFYFFSLPPSSFIAIFLPISFISFLFHLIGNIWYLIKKITTLLLTLALIWYNKINKHEYKWVVGECEYCLLIGCTRNKSTNQNLEETDI